MAKIGVEQGLTNVQQALEEKGYQVVQVQNEADMNNLDCCVVSGLDSNFLGIHDTSMKGSVIDASGMTADEVCQEVQRKFQ